MMKKLSALFLALALVFSLTACTGGTPDGSAQPSGSAPVAEGKFTPGTYEGEAKGFGGTIKVAVTLSADRIDKVEVLESTETETIGEVALESLPGRGGRSVQPDRHRLQRHCHQHRLH